MSSGVARYRASRARRVGHPPRVRVASALANARAGIAGVPAAAWVCALLALVNAACWSLITPPFQGLDEPDHFAYVQRLVESGRLPSSGRSEYSPEQQAALEDLHHSQVRFRPAGQTIAAVSEQSALERHLAQGLSRQNAGGGAGVAASEPPLYYALAGVPYALGSGGSILDRLALMRLLSALLAGMTILFVFLFVRETLPSQPWAWTVGGLGAALVPLLGFTSGTVNPDSLLFSISAALLYCLARGFRRGLTSASAIVAGVLIAAGLSTKLNFLGIVPGAVLGLVLLTRRAAHVSGPGVYLRMLLPAVAIALSPGILYVLVGLASGQSSFNLASAGVSTFGGGHGSLAQELTYAWDFYLPALPFMHNDFGELFSTRQIWFRDVVGLYGWGDTVFPGWLYSAALVPAALLVCLCARGIALARSALRAQAAAIVTYCAIALGLLLLIAAAGYTQYPGTVTEFTDARYLLPLLAMWGTVLALAARGAGRRWGPVVGAVLIALVLAHDLFSQLQVIARYYG